jgi:hypothetical protein
MTFRAMGRVLSALAVLVALAGPASALSFGAQTPAREAVGGLGTTRFAAWSFDDDLALFSASTGRLVRKLLPDTRRGGAVLMDIASFPHNRLLVSYNHGCWGTILVFDPATGVQHTVWPVSHDQYLLAATASPDGRQIAAVLAPCHNRYLPTYLKVRRLSDGKTWTIGRQLAECHDLSAPTWSADGRSLLVSYGASIRQHSSRDRARQGAVGGGCSIPRPPRLVRVAAHRSQPLLNGSTRIPPPHCLLGAPVIGGGGTFDLESCPAARGVQPTSFREGPTFIERLNSRMQPTRRWRLSPCDDGASIALNPSGHVIAASYDFCRAPHHGPVPSHLYELRSGHLVRIATAWGGNLAWDDLVW